MYKDDNCFIQLGNVTIFNQDLREIVQQSASQAKCNGLRNGKLFMKSLEKYSSEKSEKIICSTVSFGVKRKKEKTTKKESDTENIMTKKRTKRGIHRFVNEKNNIYQTTHLINPSGFDSPYYLKPIDAHNWVWNEALPKRQNWNLNKTELAASTIFLKQPVDIAENILKNHGAHTFPFQIQVYYGLSGISRLFSFRYIGEKTFEEVQFFFKHEHCRSENFQWFYLNHCGKLMEIHDTMSLKQMLVTHGAFPKGIWDLQQNIGKVLCITRCKITEEEMFNNENGLIMGVEKKNLCQQLPDHILYELSPDTRFAELFNKVIFYSEEESKQPYNSHDTVLELLQYCQRDLDIEQLFEDNRNTVIGTNDFLILLNNRMHFPYKNSTVVESLYTDLQVIMRRLRKSKHQADDDLSHLKKILEQYISQ